MSTLGSSHLVMIASGQERRIPLEGVAVLRLGRDITNDLALPNTEVSRNHARIERQPNGRHLLLDSGSRNGTFLNGARLAIPTILCSGDRFAIGPYKFEYRSPTAPRAAPGDNRDSRLATTSVHAELTPVTILVVDIHSFTTMSNQLDAVSLSGAVGGLWHEAGSVLQECGATHRQTAGDGLLAVWAHETRSPSPAEIAPVLNAALLLARLAARLSAEQSLAIPMRLGAGINTGEAVVGNPGNRLLAGNAAMGEPVNRAFRLESATRAIQCDCIIGESTWSFLGLDSASMPTARLNLELRGYAHPVAAYSLSFEEIEALLPRLR